ncbi:hypothetical protein J7K05_01185 [bacterium]|nr:hypothetical protein [bacterium]
MFFVFIVISFDEGKKRFVQVSAKNPRPSSFSRTIQEIKNSGWLKMTKVSGCNDEEKIIEVIEQMLVYCFWVFMGGYDEWIKIFGNRALEEIKPSVN